MQKKFGKKGYEKPEASFITINYKEVVRASGGDNPWKGIDEEEEPDPE